jgi:hypothetical protein
MALLIANPPSHQRSRPAWPTSSLRCERKWRIHLLSWTPPRSRKRPVALALQASRVSDGGAKTFIVMVGSGDRQGQPRSALSCPRRFSWSRIMKEDPPIARYDLRASESPRSRLHTSDDKRLRRKRRIGVSAGPWHRSCRRARPPQRLRLWVNLWVRGSFGGKSREGKGLRSSWRRLSPSHTWPVRGLKPQAFRLNPSHLAIEDTIYFPD